MEKIPEALLGRLVAGTNLVPGALREQLGERTLLVFLRHFGCIFCREAVADLRGFSESDRDFPPVLFFHQGSVTEGRAFLRRYWPAARAVADPDLEIYEAFGVGRASLLQAFGPPVWEARGRARAKGHENGTRSGDIWRMPGVFVAEGDRIVWSHLPTHAADLPDFSRLPELLAAG